MRSLSSSEDELLDELDEKAKRSRFSSGRPSVAAVCEFDDDNNRRRLVVIIRPNERELEFRS